MQNISNLTSIFVSNQKPANLWMFVSKHNGALFITDTYVFISTLHQILNLMRLSDTRTHQLQVSSKNHYFFLQAKLRSFLRSHDVFKVDC